MIIHFRTFHEFEVSCFLIKIFQKTVNLKIKFNDFSIPAVYGDIEIYSVAFVALYGAAAIFRSPKSVKTLMTLLSFTNIIRQAHEQ